MLEQHTSPRCQLGRPLEFRNVSEGSPKQKERHSRAWVVAAAKVANFPYEIVADDQRDLDMTVHSDAHTLDFQPKATSNPEIHQGCYA